MFASVWQLLTAIFVFSALTKLVYKLIKQEDPRAGSHSSQRRVGGPGGGGGGRRAQQSNQEDREVGGAEWHNNLVRPDQQRRQPGSGQTNGLLSAAAPSDVGQREPEEDSSEEEEQEQVQHQELTDEDDEFEEALSQVLSGQSSSPLSREREHEERRLRWLTRQRFRRQLNRLSGSAASSIDQASSASSEYLDACSSSSTCSSLNSPTQQQRQQQVASGFINDKHGAQHELEHTLWPGQPGTPVGDNVEQFVNAHQVSSPLYANSSSGTSDWTPKERAHNAEPKGHCQSRLLNNLSQLIAEVFLIEPLKLTCTIVRQSFKHFCAFLDFIEGIEPPLTEEELASGRTPLGGARGFSASGRGQGNQPSASSSTGFGFQRSAAQRTGGGSSHPNYFHRRYFSRRSLSAALLSDNPAASRQAGIAA